MIYVDTAAGRISRTSRRKTLRPEEEWVISSLVNWPSRPTANAKWSRFPRDPPSFDPIWNKGFIRGWQWRTLQACLTLVLPIDAPRVARAAMKGCFIMTADAVVAGVCKGVLTTSSLCRRIPIFIRGVSFSGFHPRSYGSAAAIAPRQISKRFLGSTKPAIQSNFVRMTSTPSWPLHSGVLSTPTSTGHLICCRVQSMGFSRTSRRVNRRPGTQSGA